MKVIVLPGWTAKNKKWKDEVCGFLNAKGLEAIGIDWKHWGLGSDQMDFGYELKRLANLVSQNPNCSIVAKSIGTVLIAATLNDRKLQVHKLVLCGVPIKTSDQEGKKYLGELTKVNSSKIKIFQNYQDPYGSVTDLKSFFQGSSLKDNIMEMNRGDHEYPYFDEILAFLK